MHFLHFFFGTGWSMAWYGLFYLLVAVPAAVFLGELRRPKKARERAFVAYAIGAMFLTIFTLVHAALMSVRWHVPLLMRWSSILTGLFIMATIAWTVIPRALSKRSRLQLAWVHALFVLLFVVNLCSLWIVRRPTTIQKAASEPAVLLAPRIP